MNAGASVEKVVGPEIARVNKLVCMRDGYHTSRKAHVAIR